MDFTEGYMDVPNIDYDMYNPKGTSQLVTKQNLIDIGWNTDQEYLNDTMVNELNAMLTKYNITEQEQIYHFLSQVMKESDNWYKSGLGDGLVEIGSEAYFSKYDGRLGNTEVGDGALFRGAGYLHLTGRSNYDDFYQHLLGKGIDDPLILSEGYSRVAGKYAWESATWFWSTAKNLNEKSLVKVVSLQKLLMIMVIWLLSQEIALYLMLQSV